MAKDDPSAKTIAMLTKALSAANYAIGVAIGQLDKKKDAEKVAALTQAADQVIEALGE